VKGRTRAKRKVRPEWVTMLPSPIFPSPVSPKMDRTENKNDHSTDQVEVCVGLIHWVIQTDVKKCCPQAYKHYAQELIERPH
jgi:hypothetical protein